MNIRVFTTPLVISPVLDGGGTFWVTNVGLSYDYKGFVYTVPAGYVTDLASIPRFLWIFLAPHDPKYAAAAVMHDYMSTSNDYKVLEADDVFYDAMLSTGTPRWKAWLMYHAIRFAHRFSSKR